MNSSSRPLKIVVTGASGFIGQNLTAYLQAAGFSIYPLSLRGSFDLSAIDGADVVIHLAGIALDTHKTSDPDVYHRVNTLLTTQVYDAFLSSSATTFIFLSSVKAVADHADTPLEETQRPNPKTPYARSKWAAEQSIAEKPLPPGKKYFILRPCMIHGPGRKGHLELLYKVVQKGIPWPLAAFHNMRSMLSMENLCFVIGQLITRDDIPAGVYHVADDEPISTNQLIALMANLSNRRPVLLKLPVKWISAIARLGDLLHLPLNSERLQKLTGSFVVSNAKLTAHTGMQLPLRSEEGLRRTIRSMQDNREQ